VGGIRAQNTKCPLVRLFSQIFHIKYLQMIRTAGITEGKQIGGGSQKLKASPSFSFSFSLSLSYFI